MKSRLKKTAAAAFLALFAWAASPALEPGTNTARAAETTCTGKNLFAQLQKDDPAFAARLQAKADEQAFGKGIFFRVEKAGTAPSYILGTMHVADPRITDLDPVRLGALEAADTVALEMTEMLDPQVMAAASARNLGKILYLEGEGLDGKLTPDQVESVKQLAEKAGMPWSVASRMRPFFLMANLSIPACEKARQARGEKSLDDAIGKTALAAGKTVIGLETFEGQLDAVANLPEEMKIRSLVDSAHMGDRLPDMFETMIDLYTTGDTGLIWATMHAMGPNGFTEGADRTDYAEFQRVMIDQRNVTMANGSEKLINQGNAFIAVGALHLPGENGVLNILAQRGFKISPL